MAADTASDLKWKMGMDRRGLAYDQASVLSHSVHTRWVSLLIQHKHRTPPKDYTPVTWHQLHNADTELFMLAAQAARGGVRPDIRGDKPLDKLFEQLMVDSRVTFFLMPMPGLPGGRLASVQDSPAQASADHGAQKRQKTDHNQSQQKSQHHPSQSKAQKKKGKGKGKDKSKGGKTTGRKPDGTLTHTRSGKPLCTAYHSQGGCQAGVNRNGLEECSKGLHLCNAPVCKSRSTHGRSGHTQAHE